MALQITSNKYGTAVQPSKRQLSRPATTSNIPMEQYHSQVRLSEEQFAYDLGAMSRGTN